MKLYYDAAYGLLFICAGLGIGYFDAYNPSPPIFNICDKCMFYKQKFAGINYMMTKCTNKY